MLRSIAILAVASIAFGVGAAANAMDKFYRVAPDVTIVDKLVVAPGAIVFFGMNPLLYPDWTVSIDDKIVAGPTADLRGLPVGGNAPLAPSDVTLNPIPISTASPPAEVTDIFVLAPFNANVPAQCDFTKSPPTAPDLAACLAAVREDATRLSVLAWSQGQLLEKASQKKKRMIEVANRDVRDAGEIDSVQKFLDYKNTVKSDLYDSHLIANFIFLSNSVNDWPAADYLEAQALADALLSYATEQLNKDVKARDDAKDADQKFHAELSADLAYQDILTAKTQEGKLTDKETAHLKYLAARVSELKGLIDVKGKQKVVDIDSALKDELVAVQDKIKPLAPGGSLELRYTKSLGYLRKYTQLYASRATLDRFGYLGREDCRGLAGGAREKIYKVTAGNGQAQVRVVCNPRMFLSGGLAFSGLAQPIYRIVPAPNSNATPTPVTTGTPIPVPSPGQFIRATTTTSVRTTGVILNNIQLGGPQDTDSGFYVSAGLGVTIDSSTGQLSGDYLAGISYSFSKTLVITLGTQLGPKTVLISGYEEGTQVGSGTQVQTATKIAPSIFLGFTFGK